MNSRKRFSLIYKINMEPVHNLNTFEQNMCNINRSLFSIQTVNIRFELASIQDRLHIFEQYLLNNPPPPEDMENGLDQRPMKRRRIE